ncbi:MAG: response regulator [Verrucomicrobiae bacterium]|nr:response regulator [Verrucomicrobiae bacterium]
MKRVLVAEDDFVISKLYQVHFRRNGIHGIFFSTGAGVLESARNEVPDLVILDFELPDIKGPEVMREFRSIPFCGEVPVVFVTGRATPEVVENLREEGAAEVFGKPFSPLQLIHLIERLTAVHD